MTHPGLREGTGSTGAEYRRQSHEWLTKRISYLPLFSHVFAVPTPRNTKVLLKTVDF